MTQIEQELLEKKALDQLLTGKSLFGKQGTFDPNAKEFYRKSFRGGDGKSFIFKRI